jgi:hypothetical protein
MKYLEHRIRIVIFIILLLLPFYSLASGSTYKNADAGFQVSHWGWIILPSQPPSTLIHHKGLSATILIDVKKFKGSKYSYYSELKNNRDLFISGVQAKYQDAQMIDQYKTSLDGLSSFANAFKYSDNISGSNTTIYSHIIYCIKDDLIYRINFKSTERDYKPALKELSRVVSSIRFL